ncbi:MAG TPA: UDP-N-acetylmuramate dehydrogenase [Cyclobacteriaceae bacterium]|jgi:UDP-N-acetylmuramate dehydrogenase|nr:UDP-N-acetylmuramate dehydrogenase [Cytophagales bacterium]HRE68289.1 UDP-N-acetylmuramate dehydrogenase [Cyclobacteriaceae bacterium]HRF34362.1 UDP-N-acetylmuramate dehydrogenase [Cyclobacteriaceae bacterium]
MITIEEHKDLRPLTTFGVPANARYFCRISSLTALEHLIQHPIYLNNTRFILGGGSNVLFTHDYNGLIIQNLLKGITIRYESDDLIELEVMAGEVWHDLVMHCVHHNWGGIENLSLIPGTVGAAPIQNIGAYGVEVKEVIKSVTGINLETGLLRTFLNHECEFNYRDSIFKSKLKENFFISSVTLTLSKKTHRINTSYGAIHDVLKQQHITTPSIQQVSDAVIQIRRSKLPDPTVLGNAGSFFKNPTIPLAHYQKLQKSFPEIPGYTSVNQEVKVPAGWLIEQCGWKGKRVGNVGVHTQQALVLVNYSNGSGAEIFSLASQIILSVKEKFDITLICEVNIK